MALLALSKRFEKKRGNGTILKTEKTTRGHFPREKRNSEQIQTSKIRMRRSKPVKRKIALLFSNLIGLLLI